MIAKRIAYGLRFRRERRDEFHRRPRPGVVEGRIDLALVGVDYRADDPFRVGEGRGEQLEARNRRDGALFHRGEALHRGEPYPEPGETAGSYRHGEEIDRGYLRPRDPERRIDRGHQRRRVGIGSIEEDLAEDLPPSRDRHASLRVGRIESENELIRRHLSPPGAIRGTWRGPPGRSPSHVPPLCAV